MRSPWLLLLALAACNPPASNPPPAPVPAPPYAPPTPSQPEPAAPPATTQPIPELQRKGHLSSAAIQKVVRANFSSMTACYESALRRNPNLPGGKIRVKIVIAENGTVQRAEHEPNKSASHTTLGSALEGNEPPMTDPGVIACVVNEFKKLTFPQPEGGIVIATYPLTFSSQ